MDYTNMMYFLMDVASEFNESGAEVRVNICNGYNNLTSVNLPNAKVIYDRSFYNCFNLVTLDIPNVVSLGEYCFTNCRNLTTVNIPNVINTSFSVFQGCNNLVNVSMPNCVNLGGWSFAYCSNLTTVNIPSVKNIDRDVFYSCRELVDVGNLIDVNIINSNAFQYCTNLASVNLYYVNTVSNNAFSQCWNLTSVNMVNISNLQSGAFYRCDKIVNVSVINTSILPTYFLTNLSNATIAIDNAEVIGVQAFDKCNNCSISLWNVPSNQYSDGAWQYWGLGTGCLIEADGIIIAST